MKSIYKYTKYRKEFFDNFLLKFSMFGDFNDPFEMVPGNYASSLPLEDAREFISDSTRLEDPLYHIENSLDVQAGVRASLGIICFSACNDSLLMWSHYGNNHDGICIEFDANSDFFTGKYKYSALGEPCEYYKNVGELTKVTYSKARPLFIDPAELQNDTKSWLTKSYDWAYEQEYRIILPVDHAITHNELLFYRIEKESIKSVIIGCQVSKIKKEEIYGLCLKLGIPLKESFVNSYEYKLDIFDYHPENHSKFINCYNLSRVTKP